MDHTFATNRSSDRMMDGRKAFKSVEFLMGLLHEPLKGEGRLGL